MNYPPPGFLLSLAPLPQLIPYLFKSLQVASNHVFFGRHFTL